MRHSNYSFIHLDCSHYSLDYTLDYSMDYSFSLDYSDYSSGLFWLLLFHFLDCLPLIISKQHSLVYVNSWALGWSRDVQSGHKIQCWAISLCKMWIIVIIVIIARIIPILFWVFWLLLLDYCDYCFWIVGLLRLLLLDYSEYSHYCDYCDYCEPIQYLRR